ncbi:MAG: ABC transporter permease [Chloroflexota bacterium]
MKPLMPAPAVPPSLGAVESAPTVDWMPILVGFAVVLAVALYLLFGRGVASVEFRAGLLLGLRGLVAKELRSRSRGWRPAWLLTGYLAMLTLAVAGFLTLMARVGGVITPNVGTQLFSTLAAGAVLMLAFITPALTVGSISGERERRTLELLLVTRSSALGLVVGKLAGSLLYVLFLLVASLPAFALVYLFGGVPPIYLGMVLAVAAVTAVAYAALGLLLSALLRRTIVASVAAYLLVLFLVLGVPFLSMMLVLASQGQRSGLPPLYSYASPMTSLASVLPSGSGLGMPLVGDLMQLFLGGRFGGVVQPSAAGGISTTSVYVLVTNPITGQMATFVTWAPWVYHFLFSAGLALVCVLLAALALAPVKPWQTLRLRRRPVMSNE